MKVSKNMFHKELRKSVAYLKVINFFFSRRWGFYLFHRLSHFFHGKKIKGLHNEQLFIKSNNGDPDIRVRIFKPENTNTKLPVLLYLHGGGYVGGSPEENLLFINRCIKKRPCIVVAPDYRKSPVAPYPAAFNDCYNTLLWIKKNANSINAKGDNFIIAGHSAGGGLTAAVTLKARDTQDFKLAFQMPIYPMIDDRQTTASSQMMGVPIWDAKTNQLGWNWYLEDLIRQNKEIPMYAAPARNEDYSNFPPTITFVGSLEPFKDETIAYVEALKKYNIPVEFKLYEGCFHAFDQIGPPSKIKEEALRFTFNSFAKYYDRYCIN